jgi:hypothetical protein
MIAPCREGSPPNRVEAIGATGCPGCASAIACRLTSSSRTGPPHRSRARRFCLDATFPAAVAQCANVIHDQMAEFGCATGTSG